MAFDRLIEKAAKLQNPMVAGLDPKLDIIPEKIRERAFEQYGKTLEGAAAAILECNKELIDALCDVVPAVKPQCAYYELYGWQGMKALRDTIAYADEKGMFVIADGIRSYFGNAMQAYAEAYLGETDVGGGRTPVFGADALTVNGYFGSDGVKPLLRACREFDKGIFVLVKTSNPSSNELQNQAFEGGELLYEAMGRFCEQWGEDLPGRYGYSGVGAVIQPTWPNQLRDLRRMMPHTLFLIPEYESGSADDITPAFNANGLGAMVSTSRPLFCAWKKMGAPQEDFAKCARESAIRTRDEIMAHIGAIRL